MPTQYVPDSTPITFSKRIFVHLSQLLGFWAGGNERCFFKPDVYAGLYAGWRIWGVIIDERNYS